MAVIGFSGDIKETDCKIAKYIEYLSSKNSNLIIWEITNKELLGKS